ncbi:MAG: ATP-binding protein [Nitrospirota bacterium]
MSVSPERSRLLEKVLHPYHSLDLLGSDRYKSLKIRIFFIINAIAGIPLLLVMIIGYLLLQSIMEEDFRHQLTGQIEHTQQAIEFFIKEKISEHQLLVSVYGYEQLSDPRRLAGVFQTFKKEFGELATLEVTDGRGMLRARAGQQVTDEADYSRTEWFREAASSGLHVSDLFIGPEERPHLAIAVKGRGASEQSFWVVRAVIEADALYRHVVRMKREGNDDAFLISRRGVLQPPFRVHGKIVERISPAASPAARNVSTVEIELPDGSPALYGSVPIGSSPFILGIVIKSTVNTRIYELLRKKQPALYLVGLLIVFGIGVSVRMANTLGNSIKEADRKKEEAIAESEHANKLASIGRLATGIAHEINNPLAIINEKAGLMKDIIELSADFPHREKFLTLINGIFESVNRCRTITHRLLGFARKVEVVYEVIDLNDVVREVIGFLEREILYRSIRLELNLLKELPRIQSDKAQLEQVLLNIINNALDAVEDGGAITVSTGVKDTYTVKVVVRDNGHGIPRDKVKHIFDPFFTTKEKGKGTGLGLAISYGIMKKLGGDIVVASEEGKGAAFTIEIPVVPKSEKGGNG